MRKVFLGIIIAGCLGVAAIFLFIVYPGWQSSRRFRQGGEYYSSGEWLKSIQSLRKSRPGRLKPEQEFQAKQLIANSYVRLGCYDKALAEYQELLELSTLNSPSFAKASADKQRSTLQYQIAQIYADKIKDPVLAYKNFKLYLEKYPDAPYRRDAEIRLKEEYQKIKEYYKP